MNKIFSKIEEISIDKKQEHQIRALFKLAFITGIAFSEAIPDVKPNSSMFDSVYALYLHSMDSELLEIFNEEMDDYEKGRETELG